MVRTVAKALIPILTIVLFVLPSSAAQMGIDPGRGIGPTLVGMPAGAARGVLASFGGQLSQTTVGRWRVVSSPSEGLSVWIQAGTVTRIRTVNPRHRTVAGLAPGSAFDVIARESFCNKDGIRAAVEFGQGERIHIGCPFAGLIVEVVDSRVFAVWVMPACAPFDRQAACLWRPDVSLESVTP